MIQRQVCPSMGALRRPLMREFTAMSNRSSRPFHASACKLEGEPSPSRSDTPRDTRRTRSAAANRQLQNLPKQNPVRRVGIAGGAFPAGQQLQSDTQADVPPHVAPSRGLIKKSAPPPGQMAVRRTPGTPGTMIRGPANLRTNRQGPNLRGRSGNAPARTAGRGNESGPKRRERTKATARARSARQMADEDEGQAISDTTLKHLVRLQKLEWDRTPYVPKYAQGSQAAEELIQQGQKLFAGEEPEKKKPTRLDYVLGIQHMHGAGAYKNGY